MDAKYLPMDSILYKAGQTLINIRVFIDGPVTAASLARKPLFIILDVYYYLEVHMKSRAAAFVSNK